MFKWCCLCPLCLPFNDWSKKVRKLSIISLSLRLMTVFRFMIREDVVFEGVLEAKLFYFFCFVIICLAMNHQCLAIVRKILRGI